MPKRQEEGCKERREPSAAASGFLDAVRRLWIPRMLHSLVYPPPLPPPALLPSLSWSVPPGNLKIDDMSGLLSGIRADHEAPETPPLLLGITPLPPFCCSHSENRSLAPKHLPAGLTSRSAFEKKERKKKANAAPLCGRDAFDAALLRRHQRRVFLRLFGRAQTPSALINSKESAGVVTEKNEAAAKKWQL